MSPRAPANPGHPAQPDPREQATHPAPVPVAIEIYDGEDRAVVINAVRDVRTIYSAVSEDCLERLGHGQSLDPSGKEGFLVKLGVAINRDSFHFTFARVKNLWADVVIGKKDCEKVTWEPHKELLTFGKVKQTEEQNEDEAEEDKRNEEKNKVIVAERREAKSKKFREMREGAPPGKDGEGSKRDV